MGIVILLYALLLICVNSSAVQQWTAKKAAHVLSEKIGTEVRIKSVHIGLFNRIDLDSVYIEDREGEKLLTASRLSAKIAWRQLLNEKILLRSVSLMEADINLYKTQEDSAGNWQFLLDAFKGKEKKPSKLDLAIGSVIIRRTTVAYNEKYAPHKGGQIDPKHLAFRDINADLSLRELTNDNISLRIRRVALKEQSGLDIKKLQAIITADKRHMTLQDFTLLLPSSRIHLDEATLSYTELGKKPLAQALATDITLKDATLSTADIAFAIPQLRGTDHHFNITTEVAYNHNYISLRNINLYDDNDNIRVKGDIRAERKGNAFESLDARLERLFVRSSFTEDFISRFVKEIPQPVRALGDIDAAGRLHLTASSCHTWQGIVTTDCGKLAADIKWKDKHIGGALNVESLTLDKLSGNEALPTNISASIRGEADLTDLRNPVVDADIQIKQFTYADYTYHDIRAKGTYRGHRIDVSVDSDDPELNMAGTFRATYDNHQLSDLDIEAQIDKIVPGRLGLKGAYSKATVTGTLKARIPSYDISSLNGEVLLSDVSLTGTATPVRLHDFHIKASPSQRGVRIDAATDFATLRAEGPASLSALKVAIRSLADRALGQKRDTSTTPSGNGEWVVNAEILDMSVLQQFYDIPIKLKSPLRIEGNLRADDTHMALTAATDSISVIGTDLYHLSLYVGREDDVLYGVIQGEKKFGENNARFALDMRTADEGLRTCLKWNAGNENFVRGEVNLLTDFRMQGDRVQEISTTVKPSGLYIGDTRWDIPGGDICYGGKTLHITGFSMAHEDQSLKIDGSLSPSGGDSIIATLNKVEVEYIMGLAGFHAVDFSGQATGRISLHREETAPRVDADIVIPLFLLNDAEMGDLHLLGNFDTGEKQINLNGHIKNADTACTDIKGYVNLSRKNLDLDIEGTHTRLEFLNRWISGIFGDFRGEASGHCRLFGPLKKLDLEGYETGDAEAEILATGTKYHIFGGKVHITPGCFAFTDFSLTDGTGGTGTISGNLKHDKLKNIRYDFDGQINDLLAYDKPRSADLPFYSTTRATGNVHLEGYPGSFEADMNLRPEKGTTLTYVVNTPETFGENAFVTFHDQNEAEGDVDMDKAQSMEKATDDDQQTATDIRLNMQIDANPAANIKIIMDEKAGDHILLHGSGPLRANFYNKGRFNLYGTYTIEDGIYKMTISDLIRKDFNLTRGGTLIFAGNPYQGDLDMQAVYTVNSASLSDLNFAGNFASNSVKVNCLLNFSGKVLNPQVSFDLDLPSLGEEEKQMVRSLISTEEDMNMQIIYLLGFGRFYSYNYATAGTSSTAGEQSAAAMKSFLSTTLSSQINNIIRDAMGTTTWSFGTNVSTGSLGTTEMEVDGLLSGKLFNNRLLVNGNFGYRDNSVYNTNFIGDFDVQYLLTPGGSVSLKAYSETNDRYFTKSSLTTQGVGILLHREFTGFKDFFTRSRKGKKHNAKTKKENND